MILAIDPGKDKTGIALYDPSSNVVFHYEIISTRQVVERIVKWSVENPIQTIVLGDGTHSKEMKNHLQTAVPEGAVEVVDEAYSTLEARHLYFKLYPPKGLKRLIPLSLQFPPKPVDDLVAIVILGRYLGYLPKIGR